VFRHRAWLRAGRHGSTSRDDRAHAAGALSGGGHLSIEFIEEAPDDDTPRLGVWLELQAENPETLMQAALDAGLPQVQHPGHPYYFMAPGGQVFTIAPQS
jgi:hypothetical protein